MHDAIRKSTCMLLTLDRQPGRVGCVRVVRSVRVCQDQGRVGLGRKPSG